MTESQNVEVEPEASAAISRSRWDAVGVIIASLVGLLALLVSGYTAYIQRQQVSAQVWPYLTRAYVDPVVGTDEPHKWAVFNKGVGPAIVRSVEVSVDGKPQTTWVQVFDALGLSSIKFGYSTLGGNVLSPGETLPALVLPNEAALTRFRQAMSARTSVRICYCSTLGECWMLSDHRPLGEPDTSQVAECPRLPPAESFKN